MSPTAPARPCTFGGGVCSELAEPGKSKCAKHQTEQTRGFDQRRNPALTAFYHSAAWLRARRAQLAREPNCRVCGVPATDVDHVLAIVDGGARLDPANLQSLCSKHHDKKSGRERRSRARGTWGRTTQPPRQQTRLSSHRSAFGFARRFESPGVA
jgi:5-methylcytosine-specific restriction enzyme A